MARPQRTPARSPDSIVEVKSKVRAPSVPAPDSALGASNSLLPFLAPWSHHRFSLLHLPRLILRLFFSLPPTHLPPFHCWPLESLCGLTYLEGEEKTLDSVSCTGAEVWMQDCSFYDIPLSHPCHPRTCSERERGLRPDPLPSLLASSLTLSSDASRCPVLQ